jgi:ribonucleoside-diphosphate reductase alpha chain
MKNVKLPDNAMEVFINRYSLRDEYGKSVESASEIFERVARIVSETENRYRDGIDPVEIRQNYYDYLCDLRFLPNGRTIANAGTGSGQLANCFVLPINDDLGKMNDSIFSTLRNAVLILQSGGGVGFSFGKLRHKGAFISTSKGKATGAVSFLKIYDTAFWVIGQGGGRRSACMAVLPVNHPDIEDFIRCKENEGEIEHFNISVAITDEFMEAVEEDKYFNLIDPHTQEVVRKIKARKIFDLIADYAHHNGEPGILFIDEANRDNPVPDQYHLEATNPCGEQWLGPGENCCMASINLANHVKKSGKDEVFDCCVDWEKLKETTELTTRFLDDVIDANKYVPAVPLLSEAAFKNRRIGISIMGLADMMYKIGVAYGSKEGETLAEQLMEFIRYHCLKYSIELAKQRGPFPGIIESVYNRNNFKFKIRKPSKAAQDANWKRPKLDWGKVSKDIIKYGIRNAAQNTIAPTGAIATISGLEGYGCEPVFSLSYVMKTHEGSDFKSGEQYKKLYYESRLLKQVLKRAGFSKNKIEKVFEKIRKTGTCQNVSEIPEEIRKVFVVSSDLKAKQHIKMQAALQRFVDNSISKTINFPSTAKVEDIKKAYMMAWKSRCKGLTVYVTGSRDEVVFESGEKNETAKKDNPYQTNGYKDLRGKPLIKELPKSQSLINMKNCPECGAAMQKAEGCITCPECGWSKCDV